MEHATRAAFSLRMAATGSTEGFRGLTHAAFSMGDVLGSLAARITIIGTAFAAGWKIGDVIRSKFIDPMLDAKTGVDSVDIALLTAARDLVKLNDISLDKINKSLSDMISKTSEAQAKIAAAWNQQKTLFSSSSEIDAAAIGIQEDGPRKEFDLAEQTRTREQRLARMEFERSNTVIGSAEGSKSSANYLVSAAENEVNDLKTNRERAWKTYEGRQDVPSLDQYKVLRRQEEIAERKLSEAKESAAKIIDAQNQVIEQETVARQVAHNKMIESDLKYQAAKDAIGKKLSDSFDAWAKDQKSPKEKALDLFGTLKESIYLSPDTRRDNAGLPLSEKGQKSYDQQRLREAIASAKVAVNKAYNGQDENQVMLEFLDVLRDIHARPTLRPDQIQFIFQELKNLKSQNAVSGGTE